MLNASKHAFDVGQSGNIHITLETNGSNQRFTFSDDGKGFELDTEATRARGLGTRIMQGLVGQLHGTMNTETGPSGTSVEVTMPAVER
jgi:two-component sensor histidine kinase